MSDEEQENDPSLTEAEPLSEDNRITAVGATTSADLHDDESVVRVGTTASARFNVLSTVRLTNLMLL